MPPWAGVRREVHNRGGLWQGSVQPGGLTLSWAAVHMQLHRFNSREQRLQAEVVVAKGVDQIRCCLTETKEAEARMPVQKWFRSRRDGVAIAIADLTMCLKSRVEASGSPDTADELLVRGPEHEMFICYGRQRPGHHPLHRPNV